MAESIARFSEKQLALLSWWCPDSPLSHYDAILCDGAVRSGKTLCMSISFFAWAFSAFHQERFALCGKTIGSLRRNVLDPVFPLLRDSGFRWQDRVSKNCIEMEYLGRKNQFFLFGGRDEGSAGLIQGLTLAGVFFDEAALMPRSFIEQALARCSRPASRFWFNCNPEGPSHWLYQEWILKANEKNACRLHFTMEDNPGLSDAIRKRYQSLYTGQFYERYVLGNWVQARGLVYPGFDPLLHVADPPDHLSNFTVSCDYGTINPTSMGLWGLAPDGVWFRVAEYYYDARKEGAPRTDEEHYRQLCSLAGDREVSRIIIDPSAASFIACIRREGRFHPVPAHNQVLDGIRKVASALQARRIRFAPCCTDSIREFAQYVWDDSSGSDRPKKEFDHAMDDIRYFVATALLQDDPFFTSAVPR